MLLFYYWPPIMLFDIIGWGLILPDQINKYNETIYVLFMKLGHNWNDNLEIIITDSIIPC